MNIIAKTIPTLLTSAGVAAKAAEQHEREVGLLQNTASKIREAIDALTSASDAFEYARAELSRCRAVARQQLAESRNLLTLARDNFKPTLGPDYNKAWDITGLVGSLAIPTSPLDVQPLLRSFSAFLIARPHEEIPSKQIRADKFDELFMSLEEVNAMVRNQELLVDRARIDREKTFQFLRRRMRCLIAELDLLLSPVDPLWKVFGFNPPGAAETPGVPENVSATPLGPTLMQVKWEPAPRAEYYHVWKRVAGIDHEPITIGTAYEPVFQIEDPRSGATIELAVSAINNGGESRRNEPILVKT